MTEPLPSSLHSDTESFTLARAVSYWAFFHQSQFSCLTFSEHLGSRRLTQTTKNPAGRASTVIPTRAMGSNHSG